MVQHLNYIDLSFLGVSSKKIIDNLEKIFLLGFEPTISYKIPLIQSIAQFQLSDIERQELYEKTHGKPLQIKKTIKTMSIRP
jgi:hypothetical protein